MKNFKRFIALVIIWSMCTPPAFADPWQLSIDGLPIELRLVEKNSPLRIDYTAVCLSEYDYFRVANFVQVEVGNFGDRLASALAEHVQICEDSKAVIRANYEARLKLRDDEIEKVRDTVVKKSIELVEQKDRFASTLLYHRLGLVGTASVIVVLSALLLR